jgi:hypothetical protein
MVRSWVVNSSNKLCLLLVNAVVVAIFGASSSAFAAPRRIPLKNAPVKLVRDNNGNPVAAFRENQFISMNWSGYVLSKFETGNHYTSASSTWVVPEVTYQGVDAVSANWVGIGGYCKNKKCKPDKTLIQLGTIQATSNSGPQYLAWYEMLPAPIIPIGSLEVHPGDVITASLSCAGKCKNKGKWTLAMKDETTGNSWSLDVSYKSSKLSVDYIEEAPTSGGIVPLADFGQTFFSASTANGGSANLDDAVSLIMEDPHGQTSNVSAPNATLDGFAACFSPDSTLAPCFDTSP